MAAASATATDVSGVFVWVAKEYLRELEKIKEELPALIEAGIIDATRKRLESLHEKRKSDPKTYADKALKKYHKNKEDINARRRELYKLKKEAAKSSADPKLPGVVSAPETKPPTPSKE